MGTALGDRIRQRRKELGYTQENVAELMHATQSWFHKIEDGQIKRPSGQRLRTLADVLGLDFDELSVLAGLADRPSTAAKFRATLPEEDAARLEEMHTRIDPLLTRMEADEFQALVRHAKLLVKISDGRRQAGSPDVAPPLTQGKMDSPCGAM
jgi:transcriptional regulator with XRE-family HTH domain